MPRADLLALTEDDLAALANRGTVKRALRELDLVAVEEAGDTVVATAPDAVVTLAAGVPIEDAACTCGAVGLCRHVVRAVLAYAATATTPEAAAESWDPGALTDEALATALRPAALRRGRDRVARGITATVVRSAKPVALLHDVETTVRFLVPHDLAYARCDCADQPPCEHVVPAIAAFRALPPTDVSGLVELPPTQGSDPFIETQHKKPCSAQDRFIKGSDPSMDAVEGALALLGEAGFAGGGAAVGEALAAAERRCRAEGVPWVADVCAELADLAARHASADAAFDPLRVARLVGEALLRADVLRAATGAVPALFAGGPRSVGETEVGSGRLVGLGTRVRQVGRTVDIDALVYDTAAHRVLALGRTTGDPDGVAPKSFADLAMGSLQRSISIAGTGAGQLVATGGKRGADGRMKLGRRPAALSAQRFEWETLLQAPALAEGIAEARGLRTAVPSPLAPRTAAAGLVVVALESVEEAGFHVASQSVVAQVRDPLGELATLAHPFHHRSAGGAERLLTELGGAARPRFVSGEVRVRGAETVIAPVAVVVEDPDGTRRMLQPHVDRGDAAAATAFEAAVGETPAGEPAVAEHIHDLQSALGELLVAGAGRADRTVRDTWARLAERSDALGSVLLTAAVRRVAEALAARADDPAWTPASTVAAALMLAPALELAHAL